MTQTHAVLTAKQAVHHSKSLQIKNKTKGTPKIQKSSAPNLKQRTRKLNRPTSQIPLISPQSPKIGKRNCYRS